MMIHNLSKFKFSFLPDYFYYNIDYASQDYIIIMEDLTLTGGKNVCKF